MQSPSTSRLVQPFYEKDSALSHFNDVMNGVVTAHVQAVLDRHPPPGAVSTGGRAFGLCFNGATFSSRRVGSFPCRPRSSQNFPVPNPPWIHRRAARHDWRVDMPCSIADYGSHLQSIFPRIPYQSDVCVLEVSLVLTKEV